MASTADHSYGDSVNVYVLLFVAPIGCVCVCVCVCVLSTVIVLLCGYWSPNIGVALITQLRTCVIKIVTFKGGHLML